MAKDLIPQDDQTLKFEEATNLTVEEAVQKEADMVAGITPNDGVLDKYIKRNREKVGERKFDSQLAGASQLDTTTLDNYIQKQREKLEETGTLPVPPVATPEAKKPAIPVIDFTNLPEVGSKQADVSGVETFYGETFLTPKPVYKHKKAIIGGLAALLLTTVGLAYGLNYLSKQGETETSPSSSGTVSTKTTTSRSSTADSSQVQADSKAFDDLFKTFFVDEDQTKPLNSAFAELPKLEEALKKLEGTSAYEAAKTKFDGLEKAITAIQAINDKFESPVIVDGEKLTASLKSGASLEDLTASALNTGRASLDSLLQGVITEARGLAQTGSGSTTTSTAAGTTASEVYVPIVEGPTAKVEAEYSHLERHMSRVPYNDQAIADMQNPAWTFTPGVLEEILRVSRERAYITGEDYILEPVNIINGNGYYNLFRGDGTYLFSLNAKTGYFVGNGSGHADALDY